MEKVYFHLAELIPGTKKQGLHVLCHAMKIFTAFNFGITFENSYYLYNNCPSIILFRKWSNKKRKICGKFLSFKIVEKHF